MNSKAIGEISEAQCLAKLIKLGFSVLLPFGNNQRYDLVVDDNGTFIRMQVKTGRLRNGCVTFNTCSNNGFTGKRTHYLDQIDFFIIYCPDNEEIYKIPVTICSKTSTTLRIDDPIKTHTTINYASNYVL